jgi:hypothetical protein
MSAFVLLGARPFPPPEVIPVPLGADLAHAATFIASMRRWRLLDGYANGSAVDDQPRTVLIARASSPPAATALARAWSTVSGFQVTVWPLRAYAGPGR